ncbi:septum site-determining protein MinC [Selenomonas sputigena]|uniref:septum site-determining protein MinC n=1 Tax=Selenomonas sputigena TaxID=69823 RepID=UPI002230F0FD|nr:septum site-determining protein MinC [Selenomonas sputigena]UZD43092.1 septum site-determining protein MinC [Selenomonas sputigena]
MEKESVLFKGLKTGLLLVLVGKPEFSVVEREIREKLESSALFFRRGTVIEWRTGTFTAKESLALKKLFLQHGLYFREMKEEADAKKPAVSAVIGAAAAAAARAGAVLGRKKAESSEMKAEPDADKKDVQMLVVNRTLRGGQEVQSQGSVLVLGNVNPGAQVIAGGSIDIRGTCRGIVHAGAYGDRDAIIIADHLMPVQIRIADVIAQSPEQYEKPELAERASVQDGRIVIEPIER